MERTYMTGPRLRPGRIFLSLSSDWQESEPVRLPAALGTTICLALDIALYLGLVRYFEHRFLLTATGIHRVVRRLKFP